MLAFFDSVYHEHVENRVVMAPGLEQGVLGEVGSKPTFKELGNACKSGVPETRETQLASIFAAYWISSGK